MPAEINIGSAEQRHSGAERRSGRDRRKGLRSIFSRYRLAGQRAHPRRKADRQKAYFLDRHSYRTFLVILAIFLLSIIDAVLTLHLISRGAAEINPVMAYFLKRGPSVFFIAKYLLTTFSMIVILNYGNNFLFRTRLRVKILFLAALVPFILVVLWEIYLCLTFK